MKRFILDDRHGSLLNKDGSYKKGRSVSLAELLILQVPLSGALSNC